MIKWVKPSGVEIETNESEASIKMAIGLGWKRKKERKATKKVEAENDRESRESD